MSMIARLHLIAAALFALVAPAIAQPAPGPGPPPNPFTYAAPEIYPPAGSCIIIPQTVAGGCVTGNSINITGTYYVNGNAIDSIISVTVPLNFSAGIISLNINSSLAVDGSNNLGINLAHTNIFSVTQQMPELLAPAGNPLILAAPTGFGVQFAPNGGGILVAVNSGSLEPVNDNAITLGAVGNRWSVIWGPSIIGDGTAGGSLSIQSTNNGSPSGDVVRIGASNVFIQPTLLGGGLAILNVGVPAASAGEVIIASSVANAMTLVPASSANGTATIPSGSYNIVGDTLAQTLMNKTLVSSTDVLGGVTMTLGSDATGDIYYRSGGVLTRLAIGTSSQYLGVASGVPAWVAARTQITANGTYYVNGNSGGTAACGPTGASTCSAGNDSNNCLTPATACLTTQHVVNKLLASVDFANFGGQIYMAHCTGSNCTNYAFLCETPLTGTSVIGIVGDSTAPTAVKIIPGPGGNGVTVKDQCTIGLSFLAFADNATNNAGEYINVGLGNYGHVDISTVAFGGCAICTAIEVTYGGSVTLTDSGSSSTGGKNLEWYVHEGGVLDAASSGQTFAGSASLTYTTAFADIIRGGIIIATSSTFTGFSGASGPRCNITGPYNFNVTNPNAIFPGSVDCVTVETVGAIGVQSGSGGSSSYAFGTAGQPLLSGGSLSAKDTWGGAMNTTSLALGGASLGGNALAVTGTSLLGGNTTVNAHLLATGAAPTISACGTGSPTISGGDNFGKVVAGTVASSCVINFGTTWGAAPSCNAASGIAIASLTVSATTTQLTITGTALGGDTITWICGSTALLDPAALPANDNVLPWLSKAA